MMRAFIAILSLAITAAAATGQETVFAPPGVPSGGPLPYALPPSGAPLGAAPGTIPAAPPAANSTPPVTTVVIPAPEEYIWYQPAYWWGPIWKGSVEVGVNGSAGNSEAFSMRLGANLKRETKTHILTLDASHARTNTNSLTTQNNALGKARLERLLGDSPWSIFFTGSAEYDEFKDFDLRLAAHAGLGYAFIKNERTKFVGRFGSGVSHEIGGPDDSYVPEGMFGLDFEHAISPKQKFKISTEYLPEWGDFANYRLVTDASYEVVLDEAKNLSLKIGAIDRYDSTPGDRQANDIDYVLLLLWKL